MKSEIKGENYVKCTKFSRHACVTITKLGFSTRALAVELSDTRALQSKITFERFVQLGR